MTPHRLLPLLLIAATFLSYSNSLSIPLIFDDQNAIVENQTIRSLTPLSRALAGPAQSSTAGRPLVNLSFAINYALGGLAPTGYHVFNLVMHTLCGLLVFGLVWRTLELTSAPQAAPPVPVAATARGKKKGSKATAPAITAPPSGRIPALLAAFFCALLWLLHPMQTEAIDYVTQRSESMMALAYLGTAYAFVRSQRSTWGRAWQAVAVLSCALGAFCKESIVTAPLAILLFDIALFSATPMRALRSRPAMYAGLACTWLLLAVLNASGPRSHSAGFASGISVGTYLRNQGPIILHYFQRALVPVRLIFDYGIPRRLPLAEALPAVLAVGGLFLGSLALWRVDRRLGFLATWVFITLAPTSSLVPIATEVGAERRMYLPLLAIVVMAVVAAQRMIKSRQAVVASLTLVSLVFVVLTFRRNNDYKDPIYLWQTVIDRYPHGRAYYGLGMELKAAGRTEESFRAMEVAARDFAEAEYAIGFEYAQQGRHLEAIAYLRRYVEAKPDDLNVLRAYNLIGSSSLALNQNEEARVAFSETLKRNPGNVDALGSLGDALVRLERFDEAIPVYQQFLRSTTTNAAAYFNYGLALAARDRPREAAEAFRASLALNPRDPAAHANLANALVRLGDVDGAIVEYQRVMALDSDPDARRELQAMIDQLRTRR